MLCMSCVVGSIASLPQVMSIVPFSSVLFPQLEFVSSAVHGALQLFSNETKRIHGPGAVMMHAAAVEVRCKVAMQHHPILSAEAAEH